MTRCIKNSNLRKEVGIAIKSKETSSQFESLLLLLAAVTYNQVQPLRINYQATEFLPKLELYG